MFIERFLNWLSEDPKSNTKNAAPKEKLPKGLLVASTPTPSPITQRSLPSPERLCELAADYDVRQLQFANQQYEAFFQTGYPNFVQWIESLIEKSALLGGRLLLLTFDNSTGIVTAATPEPRLILPPVSYALPIAKYILQRLAVSTADHFQKANFRVHISRQESTCSRLGAQLTPAYDCLDIFWEQTQLRSASPENFAAENGTRSWQRMPETAVPLNPDAMKNYETVRLSEYSADLQQRAWDLFLKIKHYVGESKARSLKGSFSVVSSVDNETVAKVIVFERRHGRTEGDLHGLADGVYILIRASGDCGDRIWNAGLASLSRMDRYRTIGIAPKTMQRFTYNLVTPQADDEALAGMLRDCLKAAER